jgi:hypothetical protein
MGEPRDTDRELPSELPSPPDAQSNASTPIVAESRRERAERRRRESLHAAHERATRRAAEKGRSRTFRDSSAWVTGSQETGSRSTTPVGPQAIMRARITRELLLGEAQSWAEKERAEQDMTLRTAYSFKKWEALRKAERGLGHSANGSARGSSPGRQKAVPKSRRVSGASTGAAPRRRKALPKQDGAECSICSWKPWVSDLLHWHHIVPVARGGSDGAENLILLCPNHHAIAHNVSRRSLYGGRYWGPRGGVELRESIAVWEQGEVAYGFWLARRALNESGSGGR